MPIIEDLTISEDIRLIVWEISETINDLKTEDLLSEDSLKLLNQRKSEIHKKQFFAIRNILKELSIDDQDLVYDESGKPFIKNGQNIYFFKKWPKKVKIFNFSKNGQKWSKFLLFKKLLKNCQNL